MQFGLYAPIPMATVGSPQIAQAAAEALSPLPDGRRDAQFDYGLELLLAADAAGFDLALFAERHLGHDLAAWVLASAIAPRLERIKPLVAVHPGLWDPVMTAKLSVSLDRISKQRMAINIVNGWFDEEFKMFGGTVLQGEDRYTRTTEFIAILRGLWNNETFSFAGEHYNLDKGQLLLKPGSTRPPEIYSVSRSDRGRRFIAEECDWWFIEFPKQAEDTAELMRQLEASVADMNARTAASGRKVRYALNPFIALADSPEQALDQTVQQILAHESDPDTRKIEQRMLPALKAGCVGTPLQVRQQVQRFADLGIELVLCKMIPSIENMQRIAGEVIAPGRSPDHAPARASAAAE